MALNSERIQELLQDLRRTVTRWWRRAKRLRPAEAKAFEDHRRARAWLEKGRRAYNKKHYNSAIDAFHTAIEYDPHEALGPYFLGLAYYKQQKTNEAVAAWRRAVDADPDSEAAEKARRKIDYVQSHMTRVADELKRHIRHG